ncbi:hypothetical protein [Acetobacter persici]|nr:hypothetical protein [Acetobacter persici]
MSFGGGWWVVGCGEVWNGQAGWSVAGSGVGDWLGWDEVWREQAG